jgi:hypothetical protein
VADGVAAPGRFERALGFQKMWCQRFESHLLSAHRTLNARVARPMIRLFLIALGLLVALAASLHGSPLPSGRDGNARPITADVWPRWRGMTAEGRAASTLPTRWTAVENIRWRTPIPGRGHSSPIVFGERVYVTAAFMTTSGRVLQRTVHSLIGGLVAAVVALALCLLAHRYHGRSPSSGELWTGISIVSAVLVVAVIGCSGDALFDFARCNICPWIASTVLGSLCLALTAACTDRHRMRLGIALGAAVCLAIMREAKNH